jgi:hypothetical protein
MLNDYENAKSLQAQASGLMAGQYIPPTARRQLEDKRFMLQGELKRVEDALAALDAHPELEAFTETLKAALR